MTRTLRPIGERVLTRRDGPSTVTKSGLHIPATAQESKTQRGEVLAVGSRVTEVEPGNRILFNKSAGTACELDGEKYLLLHEEDIIGVL